MGARLYRLIGGYPLNNRVMRHGRQQAIEAERFSQCIQKNTIVKTDGKDIAETKTPKTAEEVADRLNSEEANAKRIVGPAQVPRTSRR
jgi:hypothetical protein